VHIALSAGGEKLGEMALGIGERIGVHDAGDVETVCARDVVNGSLEAVGVV
jgi:hypothetical protein